jgi:hypothetical protein
MQTDGQNWPSQSWSQIISRGCEAPKLRKQLHLVVLSVDGLGSFMLNKTNKTLDKCSFFLAQTQNKVALFSGYLQPENL